MSPQERAQKIQSYGSAYDLLVGALKQFPEEMWQFRASADDWTIHEVIIHIADSEANSYIRCRRAIAEPGSAVLGYDEMRWAKELHYHQRSTDEALDLFRALRLSSYHLIQTLPEPMWGYTIEHSNDGTMTLDDWLNTYEAHVRDHVEQMERVYAAWQAQQGG